MVMLEPLVRIGESHGDILDKPHDMLTVGVALADSDEHEFVTTSVKYVLSFVRHDPSESFAWCSLISPWSS